ncbi:MAG: hypothetical protein JOZ81_35335, partial [Chloroflexi bacterium]|nr:hypothetical protein [Chloroflexota bacterium]
PQVTSSRHVVGATVTWTEHGVADFAVEAVVRRGKITSLVYRPAPPVASSSTIPAPLLFAAAVATLGLLVVGARALLNAGAPAVSARSRLRGHLLADLDQWHDARRA